MRDLIPGPWDHDLSRRQTLNRLSHPGTAPFERELFGGIPHTPVLYSHPVYLAPKHTQHPKNETPLSISGHPSISASPQALAATHLFSVSVDFPFLDITHKWNHTTRGPFECGFFRSV